MGGGEMPKIPDWKIYTIGEHVPELQHTQRMLKSVGLKVIIFCNKICHLIICFMFLILQSALKVHLVLAMQRTHIIYAHYSSNWVK